MLKADSKRRLLHMINWMKQNIDQWQQICVDCNDANYIDELNNIKISLIEVRESLFRDLNKKNSFLDLFFSQSKTKVEQ